MGEVILPDVHTFTSRLQKQAFVEVECGTGHGTIYVPDKGWTCRYSRGNTEWHGTGLIVNQHQCHWCNGYMLMKATTPKDKQLCDNCGGPVRPTGEASCWPDLLIVDKFVDQFWIPQYDEFLQPKDKDEVVSPPQTSN